MTSSKAFTFADPSGEVFCWIGSGVPGIATGERLVILSESGEARAERTSHDIPKIEVSSSDEDAPVGSGPARLSFERNGESHELDGFGAVLRPPAGEKAELVRALVALDGDTSLALYSERPAGAEHDAEQASAWLLRDGEAREISEPLLSTEYEESGAATRAGLELWVGESDEVPVRGAGIKVTGTSIDLDGWQLDAGFYRWRIEGSEGEGSYLIWRR